ncbi:MAG: carboxypeptidase-like regulatory domain-containing protein, partial [Candidatus Marinimicrobia bacterium]|nr:carboxypeptidase-like regulatory domain-containing protein [Candidatus Neomarinimicrobiota bacterium]
MSYRFFLFAIVMLLVPSLAFGATSGKLKGTITDQETGGPLVGANVVISGTSMGAATDEDGKFVILNVPIGVYEIDIKYIGYQNYLLTEVKITADLTTAISAELSSVAVQVGAVTVVAQRPLVNMNATNAVRIVGSEELLSLPVRGVRAVVALQAGVVIKDNKIYIRGGRDDEVGYYIDGASSRDIMTGDNAINIIPESVEEFQLQAGGFSAQYGGANSGILTTTLKTGGSSWKFSIQGETDKLAGENKTFDDDKQFLDTYSYGYTDLVATISGALTDKIRLFAAGERQFQRDSEKVFWTGFKFEGLVDSGNRGGIVGEEAPTLDLASGNVPFGRDERWTANGTLLFDLSPIRLRFSANATTRTAQRRRNNSGNLPILNILNGDRIPESESSNGLYSLRLTHLLTPVSYYEVSVNYFDSRAKTVD